MRLPRRFLRQTNALRIISRWWQSPWTGQMKDKKIGWQKNLLCQLILLSPSLLVLQRNRDGTSVAAAAEPLAVSATTSVHLTSRFSLSPVSPGYIPGGPQLASYLPADTPPGFPWVYPRGTTTGQLPTGPTPVSGRVQQTPPRRRCAEAATPPRLAFVPPDGARGQPQSISVGQRGSLT